MSIIPVSVSALKSDGSSPGSNKSSASFRAVARRSWLLLARATTLLVTRKEVTRSHNERTQHLNIAPSPPARITLIIWRKGCTIYGVIVGKWKTINVLIETQFGVAWLEQVYQWQQWLCWYLCEGWGGRQTCLGSREVKWWFVRLVEVTNVWLGRNTWYSQPDRHEIWVVWSLSSLPTHCIIAWLPLTGIDLLTVLIR